MTNHTGTLKKTMRKAVAFGLTAVLIFAAAGALAGCGSPAEQEGGKGKPLTIVTTIFPAYDFARQVAGDEAEVILLLPPGAESHTYEPSSKDILAIEKCDLFIYNGGESDAWVDGILASFEKPVPVLRMMDQVELEEEVLTEGMEPGHDHDHHDDHDGDGHDQHKDGDEHDGDGHDQHKDGDEHDEDGHDQHKDRDDHDEDGHDRHKDRDDHDGVYDEHIWTSPRNAAEIASGIEARLSELDPGRAELYRKNAAAFRKQLEELDQEFRDFFASAENKTMIFGDRFPFLYFAEEYDVPYYAAFPGCSTQAEPSAATVAVLIQKAREEKAGAIFYIEFSSHKVADSIAEAAGAETALFHSCHNVSKSDLDGGVTYVSLMKKNLETLKEVMK